MKIKIGIVGAVGRGGSFRKAFEAAGAHIAAVCDLKKDELEACARELGAEHTFTDYAEMLDKCALDAVVVGTPMQYHVPQSIMALERGVHVLCEVPAGVSIDECKTLVAVAEKSSATYMMAENYTYMKPNVLVKELVRKGLFGDVYYAEGEYLHELKELFELTPWRRHWQAGIDGITYGTHSLGPILQWLPGDRVARVSAEGSGYHYRDPRGEPYAQDTSVMMAKTERGALIKIRVDLISDRPHAMSNYQLQGTSGAYESSRDGPNETGKIWLRSLSPEPRWSELEALERFLPEHWRHPPKDALEAGHGGGDYFEVVDFLSAIRGKSPSPIGIHEAMDMTLPGLVSQESIRQGGAWLWVPNSRTWSTPKHDKQLRMRASERVFGAAVAALPEGYELRCFRDGDADAYIALMHRAGFTSWDERLLTQVSQTVLPNGQFVVVHQASGALVATALANHRPGQGLPFSGELGWVATDPAFQGKGLGRAVCVAVIERLKSAGFKSVYLLTDDERLPAVGLYLKLGFEPDFYAGGMTERWQALRQKLDSGRA